jgi:hypothetical protein
VALYPDVASHAVNQFDGRNLLWRSVIRYGTSKIWLSFPKISSGLDSHCKVESSHH